MMEIEIIPNWHPVLVHFTIALLGVSVVLFIAELFVRKQPWHIQLVTVARWNLWLGALAAVVTVIAGFYAFNAVPHSSEAQHLAMLDHRGWALSTAALFVLLAVWSFSASLRGKADFKGVRNLTFVFLMIVAGLMLAATGYKGAELVYRHGLGVIPMQKGMEGGHNHSHSQEGHGHGSSQHDGDGVESAVAEPEAHMDNHNDTEDNHGEHEH